MRVCGPAQAPEAISDKLLNNMDFPPRVITKEHRIRKQTISGKSRFLDLLLVLVGVGSFKQIHAEGLQRASNGVVSSLC